MKIVVLAGGCSPERDVSLSSGCLIANALLEKGHQVLLLDLYLGLEGEPPFSELFHTKDQIEPYRYTVPETEPDLERLKKESGNGEALIGKNVIGLCQAADLVWLALHGSIGENGQIQAMFDVMGIRYTGTGYAGSLLAMDKDLTKQLLCRAGVKTPAWVRIDLDEEQQAENQIASIGYPCFMKPCSCGSSVGVTQLRDGSGCRAAIAAAEKYETTVLVEKAVTGREFSVGILDKEALPPIEIIPYEGFYDYKNKYQIGLTKEVCPAELTWEQTALLQQEALKVHRTLRLGYYSRVDFILDQAGTAYCLEANTLPGMTPTSLLPQEAKAVGIDYPELCERIALAALEG